MRDCFATQTGRVVRSTTCHLLCVTLVFRLHVGVNDGLGLQWKINGGGSPLGGEHTEMHGCRCRRYKYSAAAERHSWLRPQLPACLAWEWHTDKRWSRGKYFHSFMHLWKGACQLRRLQPRLIVSLSVWEVLFLGDPPEPQTMTGLTASPTMHFRRREDTLAAFQRVRFFVTLVHRFFFPLCVNDSGKSGRHVVKNELDNYANRLTICVFLCVYHIFVLYSLQNKKNCLF